MSAAAKLTASSAVLLVKDVVKAANHYRDAMGFGYERFWGEPPSFVILHRDGMYVMLKQADAPKHVVPHWTVSDKLWNIYFWVSDVDALYAEFVRRGPRLTMDFAISLTDAANSALKTWMATTLVLARSSNEAMMRIPAMACGVLVLALAAPAAHAQDYPSRPIRIVVPAAPGGSSDILARLMGGKLHERLGQPVVVENRAGAGQMIGADIVAKSAPDGHTILLPTVTYTTSAATQPKLPFDPVNDLTGITMIGEGPFLLAVHPSLPVKSVKELIAVGRAKPGKLNYGSAGTGSIIHLITEVFAASVQIKLVHVPYKGIAPAVIDTVGGHVPMLMASLPSVLPQVKAGRLRALGVTTAQRSRFVPELPTIAEAGVPGYEARQWWGVSAPGKTPRPVIARLNSEIIKILAAEDVKSRLADEGAEPVTTTPEAFGAIVKSDIAKWSKVVKELNIKPD